MWQSISSLIPEATRRHRISPAIDAVRILKIADEACLKILGAAAARYLKPRYFKDQTLIINAAGSAVRSECQLRREELRREINSLLNKEIVKKVMILLRPGCGEGLPGSSSSTV